MLDTVCKFQHLSLSPSLFRIYMYTCKRLAMSSILRSMHLKKLKRNAVIVTCKTFVMSYFDDEHKCIQVFAYVCLRYTEYTHTHARAHTKDA